MGRSRWSWIIPLTTFAVLATSCGDDDDDSTGPPPDAGIGTMVLTVAGTTIRVDADGTVTGELESLPLSGTVPVTAEFLNEAGQPHTGISPERYTFEVFIGDTLGLVFEPGGTFSGNLTTHAPGNYSVTFRLVDETNDGTEISLGTTLLVDSGIDIVRLIVGSDTVEINADVPLPGSLPPFTVGTRAIRAEFLGPDGQPAPEITPDEFSLLINTSDTNVVTYESEAAFAGSLTAVAPGVASVAIRLRAETNASYTFVSVRTVIVQ